VKDGEHLASALVIVLLLAFLGWGALLAMGVIR
jgi:hypothetical protein